MAATARTPVLSARDPAEPLYQSVELKPPNALPGSAAALVLDYLVHSGFTETAKSMVAHMRANVDAGKAGRGDGAGVNGDTAFVAGGKSGGELEELEPEPEGEGDGEGEGDMDLDGEGGEEGDAANGAARKGVGVSSADAGWNGATNGAGKEVAPPPLPTLEEGADLPLAGLGFTQQVERIINTKWRTVAVRKSVSSSILSGSIPPALSTLQSTYPSLPSTPTPTTSSLALRSLFLLHTQHFLELVRARDERAALEYARGALRGFAQAGESVVEEMRDVVAVVAYAEPEASPVGGVMDVRRRDEVAEKVNEMIMAHHNLPAAPSLQTVAAHATACRDLLAVLAESTQTRRLGAGAGTGAGSSSSGGSSANPAASVVVGGGTRSGRDRDRARGASSVAPTGAGGHAQQASRPEDAWSRWSLGEFVGEQGARAQHAAGDVEMAG